jgi:hypothetical protein
VQSSRPRSRSVSSASALFVFCVAACVAPEPIVPPPLPEQGPVGLDAGARTAMHRLTGAEWRAAALDLTGVSYDGDLPADFVLHGYTSVGAAEVTIAPLDLEVLEAAAWEVADAALPEGTPPEALLGCPVTPALGADELAVDPGPCVASFAVPFLTRAFRRPVGRADVARWVALYDDVVQQTGSASLAARALVAGALLAPDFLFRLEFGLPIEGERELRRLDGHEQAARIAFTLLDAPPSAALAVAGANGELQDPEAIVDAATAAMQQESALEAWSGFFAEWADLDRVDLVTKDAELFPGWTESLRASMRIEAELLWWSIALQDDGDLRTLFTTTEAYVSEELAALYGVPAPPPFTPTELPPERAGILTRGAFLAGRSHAAMTSPTLRGKYVRSRLLCADVPPPPPGVVTEIPEGLTGTLRDRLSAHADAPQCSSCHVLMDPIGFALENYDPIGAWRALDAGLPVDARTDLDGVAVNGGAELGVALANHPDLPRCIAENGFAHVLGHIEQVTEAAQLDGVAVAFAADEHRLSGLVAAVAGAQAFRTVGVPDGGSCTEAEEDRTRACATECGDGQEICHAGTWVGCDAPRPTPEVCNGIDDDCDGDIDGDVILACEAGGRPGLVGCVDGALTGCEPVVVPEVCNGLDDDGDSLVDELPVELVTLSVAGMSEGHPDCQAATATHTPACRAAAHRSCANRGCAPTGIGPVATDVFGEAFAIACLDGAQVVQTSFSTLSTHHGGCTTATRFGPSCNAAIHRFCAAQGMVTGYGPVENSGDVAVVACNPDATVIQTTYTELSAFVPTCSAGGERMGPSCDEAFHRYCRGQGFATGHGPLENTGDVAVAACIGGEE